jgi:hypothetical protein
MRSTTRLRGWGRLLLSPRVAGGLLLLSLVTLIGAPMAVGTAGGSATERAQPAAASTPSATSAATPSGRDASATTTSQPKPNPELCATPDAPPDCPPRDDEPDEECDGEDCLPNPGTDDPGSGPGKPHKPKPTEPADDCGITDPVACITEGIDALFRGIVEAALNPLLKFVGDTLLSTPTLEDLPQVAPLWDNSWQILLACYTTLIIVGGLIVMGHETLQTQYGAKEIAPRLVVGFLAGFLSLFAADKLIRLANGLSSALLTGGLNAGSAGKALRDMVMGAITGGGLFLLLMGLALAIMLIALLITYIVRVAFTVMLVIGAPLALMFHALPQTEGIARWWWKALAGVLAIQVAQSLTLVVALKVFFEPSGWTPFGPKPSGLVNLLVALALIFVLLKIPFWIMSATRVGGGRRSFVGSMAKGFLAYKTLGLVAGRTGASAAGGTGAGRNAAGRPGPSGASAGRRPSGPPPPPPRPRPQPRPRPDTSGGARTPKAAEVAPPIEDTAWGRGQTSHSTDSAHRFHDPPRSGQAGARAPARRPAQTALPRSAQRAREGAERAWRPLSASRDWRPATPGSAAMLAVPIEQTGIATPGRPAGQTARPTSPAPPAGSPRVQRSEARVKDRFANDPPRPVVFKAAKPPAQPRPKPPQRKGGRQ